MIERKDHRPFIRKQILNLYSCPQLTGRFQIRDFNIQQLKIKLIIPDTFLVINFPQEFPQFPPVVSLKSQILPESLNQFLVIDDWTPKSEFSQCMSTIIDNIFRISQSNKLFCSKLNQCYEMPQVQKNQYQTPSNASKLIMNGCSDTQLTQTKNLNRHFRSKIKEIYQEMNKEGKISFEGKKIEKILSDSKVGFQEISQILKVKQLNLQLNKQMNNGKFIHKIQKAGMSVKSKKIMIKYLPIMMAAVENPDSFTQWKY